MRSGDTLDQPRDPASARRLDQPGERRDPGDGRRRPRAGRATEFNLVAQARRQAGLDVQDVRPRDRRHREAIDPSSTYYVSAPCHYQPDPNVPAWDVTTYDHSYSGWSSIRSATLRSDNTVYAQLTVDVGPENVAAMAKRMGVQTPLLAVPSLGLGSIAISPLDLASGYATLAGRRCLLAADGDPQGRPRRGGRRTRSAGWGRPAAAARDDRGEAYVVTKILEENVQYGTGTARGVRPAGGRQDRHDRRPRRRLVRRLHARPHDRGLGRLPAGRDPDGERARHRRVRRQLPRRDLAPVHGAGARVLSRRGTGWCRTSSRPGRRGTAAPTASRTTRTCRRPRRRPRRRPTRRRRRRRPSRLLRLRRPTTRRRCPTRLRSPGR